jgi:hypothetical protein
MSIEINYCEICGGQGEIIDFHTDYELAPCPRCNGTGKRYKEETVYVRNLTKRPPKTICVDFDGTLCDWTYPDIGAAKKGAKDALTRFRELGYKIIIWSCRTSHYHYDIFGGSRSQPTSERETVKNMVAFLDKEGIPYDEIDYGDLGKPLADLYIDDKGIRFEDNWEFIKEWVEDYRP